jgi:acyl-CoA synthetase (AMP-forming)/AMP-acid ligase II
MDYINTMDPYPPSLFYQRFIDLIKKAKTEGGINWGTILEQTAAEFPNRIAVKWDDNDMPLTAMQMVVPHIKYKEFNEAINRYANYFLKSGIQKGDVICILLANRVESLELHLAAAKIGAVSSMMNSGWRGRTLTYALNLKPGKAIVVGEEHVGLFNEARSEIANMDGQMLLYLDDGGKAPAPGGYIDLKAVTSDVSAENPPTT